MSDLLFFVTGLVLGTCLSAGILFIVELLLAIEKKVSKDD